MTTTEFKEKYARRRNRGPKPGMVAILAARSGYSRGHICNVSKGRTVSATVEAMIEDWRRGKISKKEGGRP